MAILKFRIYLEEDEAVYRDVVIRHTQSFADLHYGILKAYDFDNKHSATFYRSTDKWLRGREISFEKYDKPYQAEPLIMADTLIGSEIRDTNQRFIYVYDFEKNWTFMVELINISKTESNKLSYPAISRTEGIGPPQYGTRSLLGKKFIDIEEKYDLSKTVEGFGIEGGDEGAATSSDEAPNEDGFEEGGNDDIAEEL